MSPNSLRVLAGAAAAVLVLLTGIAVGPAGDLGTTVTFTVSNDNPGLFLTPPSIDATGKLIYALNPDAFGSATVTIIAKDDGGTDNGGMGAKHFQGVVRLMQRKDPYFDFAEVGFQLAIVLSSVAMLSQRRWAFLASAMLAALAVLLTINGFGLFLAVPGFEDIGY